MPWGTQKTTESHMRRRAFISKGEHTAQPYYLKDVSSSKTASVVGCTDINITMNYNKVADGVELEQPTSLSAMSPFSPSMSPFSP
jgi:hypothetical protein